MVELEELQTGQDSERSSARARTALLQKRFQEVITNIIKDTQATFSSLMGDLDQGKQSVGKLPRPLRPQVTDGFHCQIARKPCKLQKLGEGYPEEAPVADGCFDILSNVTSCCCRQNCPSFNEASASSSNIDRDEYEASLRLERLIEEELESRKEILKDNDHQRLYPSQSRTKLDDLNRISARMEKNNDRRKPQEIVESTPT
ncbi:hypothetical protein R1sor_007920 [Riccia sorocarpa]|uniref:Uncharacterized protein n=1 Tax=Riccia sorocarpa TaxID=122646 RepID=A0ABD3HU79_9MARC